MEAQLAATSEPPSPIFQKFNTAAITEDNQFSFMRHIDEYRTKRVGGGVAYARNQKSSYSEHSSDSGSGEDSNLAQQRFNVKASVSKYGTGDASRYASRAFSYPGISSVPSTPAVAVTPPRTPPRSHTHTNTHTHPPRPTHTHTHAPSLRTKLVLIEDYAFSVATLDLVVGQWIEFRLSEDVPAHAEHEICGVSTVKALCFESPLLQVTLYAIKPPSNIVL